MSIDILKVPTKARKIEVAIVPSDWQVYLEH